MNVATHAKELIAALGLNDQGSNAMRLEMQAVGGAGSASGTNSLPAVG